MRLLNRDLCSSQLHFVHRSARKQCLPKKIPKNSEEDHCARGQRLSVFNMAEAVAETRSRDAEGCGSRKRLKFTRSLGFILAKFIVQICFEINKVSCVLYE